LHPHPDGPFTAEQLRKQVIGFEKVKITNNESDNSGQLILNSMHKFQPRVYLVKRREGHNSPVTDIEKEQYRTFVFPETQFTAVTAYQNQCITKLKIESNPFAKGFRDSAGSDFEDHQHGGSPFSAMGSPFGLSAAHHLPGGMPGMDPFARLHYHHQAAEANNNLIMAAEKARFMMLYPGARSPPSGPPHPGGGLLPPPAGSPPSHYASMPLSPELLARYSALQASLGFYSPALLAAALRNSAAPPPPPPVSSSSSSSVPSSLNSSLSSPRSPELPSPRPHRFSPYVVPSRSGMDSPGPHSPPGGEDRAVSPPSHFPQLLR
jgi:T-box protein 20